MRRGRRVARASLCGAIAIAIAICLASIPSATSDAPAETSAIRGDDAAPAASAATPAGSPPPAQDDDVEAAAMEAKFREKQEKRRRRQAEQQAKNKAEAEAGKGRGAQEAAKEAEASKVKAEEQRRVDEEAEQERQRKRKTEAQQADFKRKEAEKSDRARKQEEVRNYVDDPRDAALPGEMDELELERRAFEQAEKAVRDEEARQEALKFAAEEAKAAEELSRLATERARQEAQRLFNEQDLVRRRRGAPDNAVAQKVYSEPPLRCALCHVVVIGARGIVGRAAIEKLLSIGESVKAVARTETPGVVAVPRWFAELMSKARFRGISLTWEVADVTNADSLDRVFAGAKAAIFAVTATPSSQASLNRDSNLQTPEAVDNLGLANVARKAGEHAVERLIIISQAGVTRPVLTSLNTALWGSWSRWPQMAKAMHWNLLKHKRLGELAAIRECRETRGETSYTIIRPASMGNSTHERAWAAAPESIKTQIGDNMQDGRHSAANKISRAQVAALAVEAIFTEAAINRVVEVSESVDSGKSGKQGSPKSAEGSQAGETNGKARGEGASSKDGKTQEGGKEVSAWEKLFLKHRPGIGSYMSAEDMRRMAVLSDIKNNMLMLSAKPSGSGGEAVDVNAVVLADANAATESTNFTGHAVHMQTREL